MTWQTVLLVLLVILWAAAQYGLAAHALVDLRRRPSVRGGNKVVWTLVILGVPIAGALIYTVYGPTSFIRRTAGLSPAPSSPSRSGRQSPPPDPDQQPNASPRRHDTRVNRPATRVRRHVEPIELRPELPELADFDGEVEAEPAASEPRRTAYRLVRQAQRRVRR